MFYACVFRSTSACSSCVSNPQELSLQLSPANSLYFFDIHFRLLRTRRSRRRRRYRRLDHLRIALHSVAALVLLVTGRAVLITVAIRFLTFLANREHSGSGGGAA